MVYASHLGKKLLLSNLPDVMLYKLDIQDSQKWLLNLPEVEIILWVPASWKSLPDIFQDTEESDRQTVNICGTVFEISCFMEKSAGYYGPVG